MMKQRDMVIGAVTGYRWEQIKLWANSLEYSGFKGIKAVIAYNMDFETMDELTKRGFSVMAFQKDENNNCVSYPKADFSIVVERFLHYWLMLDQPKNETSIRYIVATDVKDVVFQQNPSIYLDGAACRDQELVMSSESIAYQDEPWGKNNLTLSFGPIMYERHKQNTIINCGVLAGKFASFLGLCKSIYLVAAGAPQHVPGGGGPDQAALNLILTTPAYKQITQITTPTDTWAAQLGTTMDPHKIESYRPCLKDPVPTFDTSQNLVVNPNGIPYSIVHQYDRVPEIKAAFERIYA